jgi:FMN phosphatase YigB (HAD superfamily)
MITHVCFDRAGVAAEHDLEQAIRIAQRAWPLFTEEKFKEILKGEYGGRNYKKEFQEGRIDKRAYLNSGLKIGHLSEIIENAAVLYYIFLAYYSRPFYPIIDLNRQLRDQKIHTSVLSNASEISWEGEGSLIKDVVDIALASFEIGVTKPNRRAYEILLDRIGATDPTTVLFVDDHKVNVDAAKEVGMQGFHFDSDGRTMNDTYKDLCGYLQKQGVFVIPYEKPIIHKITLPDGTTSEYLARSDMTPDVLRRMLRNEFQ